MVCTTVDWKVAWTVASLVMTWVVSKADSTVEMMVVSLGAK